MTGRCDARPELAADADPAGDRACRRCRAGAAPSSPAGCSSRSAGRVDGEPGPARPGRAATGATPATSTLRLTGTVRLADALNHLYVLLPVLDDAKHYWVSTDEVDKLIRAGGGWLAGHPEKALITRRYLRHRESLTRAALARLAEVDDARAGAAGRRRCRRRC